MEYQGLFINALDMMRELKREVERLRIPITIQKVHDFDDLSETVIFNCSGLGAKALANDTRVVPVQGHLITLKDQPPREELQYMLNVHVTMQDTRGRMRTELIYYAPKESGIVGITFLRGQDSLLTNHHEFDRIIQRCQDFF
jgi:hypothetical protein